MIIIGGDTQINVDKRDAAIAAFVRMQRASQAEEDCLTDEFSADLEEQDTFHLFEVWENEETLAAHGQTPHMAAFRKEINELRRDANIKRYRAEIAS